MAVTNTIPKIWSARVTYFLSQMSAFLPNASRNYEGDATMGNQVKVPTIDRTTVVHDYSRTADLNAPEDIDTTTQDLDIDQEKYFNFALEDLDAAQNRIGGATLIDAKSTGAGLKIAETIDEFVLSKLNGVSPDSSFLNLTAAGTAGTFNINFVNQAKLNMTIAGLLRSQGICITTPEIVKKVEDAVVAGTYGDIVLSNNFTGGVAADPQASATFAFRAMGMDFYVSNSQNMKETASGDAPTGNSRGVRSLAYVYNPADLALVVQVNKVETYRLEKRFATGVKGLVNYGCKVLNAGRMQKFLFTD